ncbi:MAG: hypothetical protein HPY90_14595 [Syntrophothermus sp.]|uniref:hypothetical protein n=1 Tax=Syntrophothermus sp. TaxID=2736299 RepID=UPI0025796C95|nr:hypothetical protein [Syntrophothermus sp.]NSW84461.1 hypothetical protein [Syntrophothermus sp.]
MYNFLSTDEKWDLIAVLHNLISLKRLHDAGYDVQGRTLDMENKYQTKSEDVVGSYLEIIFGEDKVEYRQDASQFLLKDPRIGCLRRQPGWEETKRKIEWLLNDLANCTNDYYFEEAVAAAELADDCIIIQVDDVVTVDNQLVDVLIKLDRFLGEEASGLD